MKNKTSMLKFILPVIGIIILVNILSDSFFFRLDFTADKRYTLSKATKDILASLKEPVTVKAYFSENTPPDIAKVKRDFKDLLIEYANRSKGKVVYTFINPNEKEELEQQATQAGVQPVMINVRDKDQMKQQKAYMGAVVQMGEKSEVIPFMQPGSAMEYALSSSIKKLSVAEKPVIGMLQGHGEATARSMQQVWNGLTVLYDVQDVTLSDNAGVPDKIKTLLIVDPKDSFPQSDLHHLDEFLALGKSILICYSRETADFTKATGSSRHTGLEDWLAQKQIQIGDQFVVDATCGSVTVRQQQGPFMMNTQIQFPYFPLINKFEDHPVTKGLSQVLLRFPSPLKYTGDSSIHYVPIIKTSDKAGLQPSPTFFNIQKQWTAADFPMQNIVLGAAFTGAISGSARSKMVVIDDGSFAVNGEGQQAQQLPADNVNLFINAVDWLSDESGLVELRTKGVSSRPLSSIEEGTKIFYKYLNFLLPMLLIIGYGFFRSQMKRSQRLKRMEENYS
jgi:gliding-associated putative ABC transporter substrate-binding component GldG